MAFILKRVSMAKNPSRIITATTIEDVAGCLKWKGPTRTLADMERAIAIGARVQLRPSIPDPYLEARAKRGSWKKFKEALAQASDVPPDDYDKLDDTKKS
jgi:hypothetical protein